MITEPKYVTCRCQHCDNGIEFDASGFATSETRTVECPHCKLETMIFVPPAVKISKANEQTIAVPTKPITVVPPTLIQKHRTPISILTVLLWILLSLFLIWTTLIGIGVISGLISVAQSEAQHPVITNNNDQTTQAFGTIGFIIGLFFWFGIWLMGAVPLFVVWFFVRTIPIAQKNYSSSI